MMHIGLNNVVEHGERVLEIMLISVVEEVLTNPHAQQCKHTPLQAHMQTQVHLFCRKSDKFTGTSDD